MDVRLRPIPRTRRWGIGIAAVTAVISGFAVFMNGYGVRAWKEAGVSTASYTTMKNLVAAVLLGTILVLATRTKRRSGFTRPQRPAHWFGLAAVAFIGGAVPFLLFFEGLSRATSGQAALLHKTLVIWVALLAVPLLREHLGFGHLAAIGLLIAGQIALAGGITDLGWGVGEAMILAATLMWSVEYIIAKRLLADLSPLTVGATRMGAGVAILLGYGIVTGGFAALGSIGATEVLWVLATGTVLTAFVATWYAALSRAQAVDVAAVLVFGGVITAFLQNGFADEALPSTLGLVLMTLGAVAAAFAGWRDRQTATG